MALKEKSLIKRKAGRPAIGDPDPMDLHVGARLRLRRTLLGMSQEKLGEAIGLTFQQVQKYERGANRIGASRLFELSQALDVPVSFFFDGAPEPPEEQIAQIACVSDGSAVGHDQLGSLETSDLLECYYSIDDQRVRRRLFELIRSLGDQPDPTGSLDYPSSIRR